MTRNKSIFWEPCEFCGAKRGSTSHVMHVRVPLTVELYVKWLFNTNTDLFISKCGKEYLFYACDECYKR